MFHEEGIDQNFDWCAHALIFYRTITFDVE